MTPQRRRLIGWLRRGNAVTEDGDYFVAASRSGGRPFDGKAGRKLVAKGAVIEGQHYEMKSVGRATWVLAVRADHVKQA